MTDKEAIKILAQVKVADLPYKGCHGNQTAYNTARDIAINAIKNNQKIITCKECVHRGTGYCPMQMIWDPEDHCYYKVRDDDFCSRGKLIINE